jgi:hypothetical protein
MTTRGAFVPVDLSMPIRRRKLTPVDPVPNLLERLMATPVSVPLTAALQMQVQLTLTLTFVDAAGLPIGKPIVVQLPVAGG